MCINLDWLGIRYPRYIMDDTQFYCFFRDNLLFLLKDDYSKEDILCALERAESEFWKILYELNKEGDK